MSCPQLVWVALRLVAGLVSARKVCVYELVPLFDVSQPTLSFHLKLRDAGIVDSERRGLWA